MSARQRCNACSVLACKTVADLAELEEPTLIGCVGAAHGQHLYRLAWGIDDRPVEPDREMKSIGHEETFAVDRHTHAELVRELVRLADAVAARLRAHGGAARTLTLKVRFAGFETITRSITVGGGVSTAHSIVAAVEPLLQAIDASSGVRLLGVSASNFTSASQQLSLDDLLSERGRRRAPVAARRGDCRRDSQAIRYHIDRSGQRRE